MALLFGKQKKTSPSSQTGKVAAVPGKVAVDADSVDAKPRKVVVQSGKVASSQEKTPHRQKKLP